MKKLVVFLALGLIRSSCFAGHNEEVLRGRYPYLQLKNQTAFSDGTSDRLRALAWHPMGQMFAIAGGPRTTGKEVELYNVRASDSSLQNLKGIRIGSSYQVNALTWSPKGNYLALGGSGVSTNQFKIYSYIPGHSDLTAVTSLTWGDSSSSINSVAWHPSGRYMAIGGGGQSGGSQVLIYYLDLLTPLMTPVANLNLGSGAVVNALSWSSDGMYLAVGCKGDSTGKAALQTYLFTVARSNVRSGAYGLIKKSKVDFGGAAAYVCALAWSPDNDFIVAGGYSGGTVDDNEIKLYRVSHGLLTNVRGGNVDFGRTQEGAYVTSLVWDPLQRYLIAGGYAGISGFANPQQFNMYEFNCTSLTPKAGSQNTFGAGSPSYVSTLGWHAKRGLIVVGGYKPINSNELWLMEFLTS